MLLIFISPEVFQSLAIHGGLNIEHMLTRVSSYSAFYLYMVFHNSVLYEKLLVRKRYIIYALLFPATLFFWRESHSYLTWLATKAPGEKIYTIKELKYNAVFWFFVYWANIIYVYFSLGVYLSFRYFNERAQMLQAENERKELELKQLNAQLNPHFLFNALNNIYSYELRNAANGGELILKLSELMRYILDSHKKTVVPLQDELAFIEHYIAFERERVGERCIVHYDRQVHTDKFCIVPLLLFNIIENAFKHGTTSIETTNIYIHIRANDKLLSLYVTNYIFRHGTSSTQTGQSNMRRRLDLLYKDAYALSEKEEDNQYKTTLELCNLSPN